MPNLIFARFVVTLLHKEGMMQQNSLQRQGLPRQQQKIKTVLKKKQPNTFLVSYQGQEVEAPSSVGLTTDDFKGLNALGQRAASITCK